MDINLAKRIVEQNPCDLSLHEDYSGRCMYGRTTAGVSTSDSYMTGTYVEAVMDVLESEIEDAIFGSENMTEDNMIEGNDAVLLAQQAARKVVDGALNGSTDSMGLGTIWY